MHENTTPKQKVVQSMERPFELVEKQASVSPLQRKNSRLCDHKKVYKTSKYPTSGPTWVCAQCHTKSDYPEDLE